MDITLLFKACVKTVKTTNKALGINDSKNNLLKSNAKDVHLTKAKEVLRQITHLQIFLTENKAAYLNVLNYLSTNKTITEIDREQIDTQVEKIVNDCTVRIGEYKKELGRIKKSLQGEEHYSSIVDSLERYLKAVSKIYTETKAVRVKRVIDTHKVAKLETLPSTAPQNHTPIEAKSRPSFDDDLSIEEMQMFESENEMLYNELNATSEEVKQMESKVVHIAELQELFTEKVLQQEQEIDRIANTVVGSTTNIKDANEQIRQAIQRNAGLRVWVLFFLLVISFSLLFLDWYND